MWHSDATLFHVADWVPEAVSRKSAVSVRDEKDERMAEGPGPAKVSQHGDDPLSFGPLFFGDCFCVAFGRDREPVFGKSNVASLLVKPLQA